MTVTEVVQRLGGNKATAQFLKVSPSAVSHWRALPLRHVPKVAKRLRISMRRLRPDVYR